MIQPVNFSDEIKFKSVCRGSTIKWKAIWIKCSSAGYTKGNCAFKTLHFLMLSLPSKGENRVYVHEAPEHHYHKLDIAYNVGDSLPEPAFRAAGLMGPIPGCFPFLFFYWKKEFNN